ncbi:MAG: hypothetical protein EPN20_08220 [Magnetospirillum sp.]|nr:MAG: hypothetical protein EPN20_08220 [Magnetospirillum sp.]
MIAAGEIVGGVYGAWRLARRDPAGLIWFDTSPGGFWHSFWGPALVLPGFLVLQTLDGAFAEDLLVPLVVQLIAYVIGCVAFPLAVSHIADGLQRSHTYIRFIVAYNWSSVIQMALLLPVALLVHLVPGAAPLNLAVTMGLLVYQAYIAHVALAVPPGTAGMLVVLDLLIGALVQMSAEHLLM